MQRNLTILEKGEYLTIAIDNNRNLVLSLSELHQHLRDPDCDKQFNSLFDAFKDIECETSWRLTLEVPRDGCIKRLCVTKWIILDGDTSSMQIGSHWCKSYAWGEDLTKGLMECGELVFVKEIA